MKFLATGITAFYYMNKICVQKFNLETTLGKKSWNREADSEMLFHMRWEENRGDNIFST